MGVPSLFKEQVATDAPPRAILPVYRAILPPVERLAPYLKRIDQSHTYSNFGQLCAELTERLSAKLGRKPGEVVLAASGTAALAGAILAAAGRATAKRPICLVPAYTFCATALAAELCGYTVHLVDVDEDSWTATARNLTEHPLLARTGLIVPVSAYGRRIDCNEWLRFREATNIPVVIDGAASLQQMFSRKDQAPSAIPMALSFHATKAFSTGEGGAVICSDPESTDSICQALNFGMLGTRACRSAGLNGKMSEYHAAVGLAELDSWDEKAAQFGKGASYYHAEFSSRGLEHRLVAAPQIASCYMLFQSKDAEEATAVCANLTHCGLEYRLWYGRGLHNEPYFHKAGRDGLPVTDRLAPLIIGLPVSSVLDRAEAARVAEAVFGAVG